jgi:CDP-glycerol glycerophosphotransferase
MKLLQLVIRDARILISHLIGKFYRRDPNLWVFGEWFGKRSCDNSLYLANYVSMHHTDIKVAWIYKNGTDLSLLDPKIERFEMDSPIAISCLKRAGAVIMNQGFSDFSENHKFYFGSTLTLNLWHGVPWKKIFKAAQGSKSSLLSRLHEAMLGYASKPKLFLANSTEFQRILIESNDLTSLQIILAGYPRNSLFYSEQQIHSARQKIIAMIHNHGLSLSAQTKIVTYMPTFRDKTSEIFSFDQLSTNKKFIDILEKENAIVVQKGHFITNERGGMVSQNDNLRIIKLNDVSAQELLAATDLLVTDYSSCFFDFLLLDRPIIHYLYDYDYYLNNDRGLYYQKEDVVCGDCAMDINELIDSIGNNLKNPNKNSELRQQRIQQYMDCEAPDSCKMIIDAIKEKLKR